MNNQEIHDMSEMDYHSDIHDGSDGLGTGPLESDNWDGSATNQSNDFFIGQSGHVTILWHIVNNPMEKYDSSKSYQMPALDGSALYVWCSLHFTYPDAFVSIDDAKRLIYQMDAFAVTQTYHL